MREFFKFFDSVFDSIQKENGNEKKLYDLRKLYGGKIETTYEKLTRVTKTWTSEDGKYVSKSISYVNGEPDTKELKLQELLALKEEALMKEDYEKCASLKKEIEELKKTLN
jgi:protein-arginine kinase activator protein McsA